MDLKKAEEIPLLRIRGLLDSLNPAEYKLARYILDHPVDSIHSTIESLAEKSDSSYATISRFSKKLGYAGFKDFRNSLISDVMDHGEAESAGKEILINRDSSPEQVVEKIFRFSRKSLDDTEAFVDADDLTDAADALISASRVLFIGAGTSGISARYAFMRFFRLGIPGQAETDPVICSMLTATAGPEDVVFAVSSSGRTRSIVSAARAGGNRGAKVIALSDYAVSPLSGIANVNLHTTPRNVEFFRNLEMPLLIGQIILIDILFSIVSLRIPDEQRMEYAETKDAADRLKE